MSTKCSTNGQRQTTVLNYEISTMWKKKPRTTCRRTSYTLMGLDQVTRPKTLQAIWWWWWWWWWWWLWWWWWWRWWWWCMYVTKL